MNKEVKHTPTQGMRLPWYDEGYKVENDYGEEINLNNHRSGIVKCVNMHDELVEVIKALGNEKISDAEFNIMRNEALKKAGAL